MTSFFWASCPSSLKFVIIFAKTFSKFSFCSFVQMNCFFRLWILFEPIVYFMLLQFFSISICRKHTWDGKFPLFWIGTLLKTSSLLSSHYSKIFLCSLHTLCGFCLMSCRQGALESFSECSVCRLSHVTYACDCMFTGLCAGYIRGLLPLPSTP